MNVKLTVDGKEIVSEDIPTQAERVKSVLVNVIERLEKEATTAEEVEALAAVARVLFEYVRLR